MRKYRKVKAPYVGPPSGVSTSNTYPFGDQSVDGSWRIRVNGTELVKERREAGVWVEKEATIP